MAAFNIEARVGSGFELVSLSGHDLIRYVGNMIEDRRTSSNLATVAMDGRPGGGNQEGWRDDQEGQGGHHQGHQAENNHVTV